MSELVAKFERSQLPVGHGGFHIGTLDINGSFFSYFFDCGGASAGKKLIETEFEQNEFDFGVVSHFDADHFSQLRKAKVKRVFIPYLEELDLFFLSLSHFIHSGNFVNLSSELDELTNNVQVVMVRHVAPGRNAEDLPQQNDTTEDNIRIEGLKGTRQGRVYSISDGEIIYVGAKTSKVVMLKFYNHHAEQLRTAISKALEDALTTSVTTSASAKKTPKKKATPAIGSVLVPPLSNTLGAQYADIEEFLNDVKENPAEIINKNAARLKAVYAEILKGHGEAGVTASNLSSLTMFSMTLPSLVWGHHGRLFSKPHEAMGRHHDNEYDGWMLTGDLELIGGIWTSFYQHYHQVIEQCTVFNVPHHGSARAFDDRAIHHITANKHFIFAVNAVDEHHPAPTLSALLQKYGVEPDNITSVTELPQSRFTLTRLIYSR